MAGACVLKLDATQAFNVPTHPFEQRYRTAITASNIDTKLIDNLHFQLSFCHFDHVSNQINRPLDQIGNSFIPNNSRNWVNHLFPP